MQSVESIYQDSIRQLPVSDQLRLADLIRQRAERGSAGRRSALEILRKMEPKTKTRSAAEIDEYLRAERDSWDD